MQCKRFGVAFIYFCRGLVIIFKWLITVFIGMTACYFVGLSLNYWLSDSSCLVWQAGKTVFGNCAPVLLSGSIFIFHGFLIILALCVFVNGTIELGKNDIEKNNNNKPS